MFTATATTMILSMLLKKKTRKGNLRKASFWASRNTFPTTKTKINPSILLSSMVLLVPFSMEFMTILTSMNRPGKLKTQECTGMDLALILPIMPTLKVLLTPIATFWDSCSLKGKYPWSCILALGIRLCHSLTPWRALRNWDLSLSTPSKAQFIQQSVVYQWPALRLRANIFRSYLHFSERSLPHGPPDQTRRSLQHFRLHIGRAQGRLNLQNRALRQKEKNSITMMILRFDKDGSSWGMDVIGERLVVEV